MSTWHEVHLIRYRDNEEDTYEEIQVIHCHPEPAEECELTLLLQRDACALDALEPGDYRIRIVDGEPEVRSMDLPFVQVIDDRGVEW